jgi:hypothetical protein
MNGKQNLASGRKVQNALIVPIFHTLGKANNQILLDFSPPAQDYKNNPNEPPQSRYPQPVDSEGRTLPFWPGENMFGNMFSID